MSHTPLITAKRRGGKLFAVLLLLTPFTTARVAGQSGLIHDVAISRDFFNPSLQQQVSLSFALQQKGSLDIAVLDRDGFVVRHLLRAIPTAAGPQNLAWNGRDDRGIVVPDEAYSFKIDLATGVGTQTYFPAKTQPQDLQVQANYYDRRSAVLSYRLPKAARIHVQAGAATVNPRTNIPNGPVLKTLVNREPRPSGAVVENWNGMDESGTTYVPDMPHFAVGIAATSLPENSIITYGNRTTTFPAWAAKRPGTSLVRHPGTDHRHHQGLTTLDDIAPRLEAKVRNAVWSALARGWIPEAKAIKVRLALEGPSAPFFARHPSKLVVYVDQQLVVEVMKPKDGFDLEIPIRGLKPGAHLAALNWASAYGPVAVQTIPLHIGKRGAVQAAARGGAER